MQEESISPHLEGEIEKTDITITVESDYLLFSEQNNDVCFVLSKDTHRAGIFVDWDNGILIDNLEVVILRAASYLVDVQRTLPPHFRRKYMEVITIQLAKGEQ